MSTKERLRELVEQLDETSAAEALDYIEWMLVPNESLTEEELASVARGEEQIARGEYRTLSSLRETVES